MKPERWQRIEELYHAALDRKGSERIRFLDKETAGDEELRRELDSLLSFDEQTGEFLESTAMVEAARSITGDSLAAEGQKEVLTRLFSMGGDEEDVGHELWITTPQGHTRSLALEGRRLSLGRSEANDLPFPEDDGLSRRHLIFEWDENKWSVIDLGSKNGTCVNGTRITGKQILRPGDRITASCITIEFN